MNRLVIKPRTPAVAVAISIVAGPPSTDSDGYEAIPEVIVVMDEVIVIMAMQVVAVPIAVPSSAACIPPRTAMPGTCGNVWPAHRTTKTATADVSTCEVGTACEVTTTHATAEVASSSETSATVSSLRLLDGDGDKKQSARKGGRDKNHARFHDMSPWVRSKRCPVRRSEFGFYRSRTTDFRPRRASKSPATQANTSCDDNPPEALKQVCVAAVMPC